MEKKLIIPDDSDNILGLCLEVILDGGSVLIFCSTKNWCEQLASTLANLMNNILSDPSKAPELANQLRSAMQLQKLSQFFNDFKQYCRGALDPVLLSTIPFGIAYHHAGKRRGCNWMF